MVIISFAVACVGVLFALIALGVLNQATNRRSRAAMLDELSLFLDDVEIPKADVFTGNWRGMPVRIELHLYAIHYEITLPFAVIPQPTIFARYASRELVTRMKRLELRVEHDRVIGRVPRENGLAESLVTVEQRIPIAQEVRALRRHVPAELVDAIAAAPSTLEVDRLLGELATWFPESPEMAEAIELASQRDPQWAERVRGRALTWIGPKLAAQSRGPGTALVSTSQP